MSETKKLPQYIAAVSVCIGALGLGTVIAFTSNINLDKGELNGIKMGPSELSIVNSIFTTGALIMCIPIGFITNIIGRKMTVLIISIPYIIGWILILFANNVIMVYSGRFLTGLAGGSFCIVAPMYTSEIGETSIRGTLGTMFQLFVTLGILYAQILGAFLSMKMYLVSCTLVPVVFLSCFILQPESPVYLVRKGNIEKAEQALRKLRGSEYNPGGEIAEIQASLNKEKANEGKFWEAMKTKPAWKSSMICLMYMFYQQLSGINAVMFYAKVIFEASKSSTPAHINTIVVGVVQVLATLIAAGLVERLGRNTLMIISEGLCGISILFLGFYFFLMRNNSKAWLAALSFSPVVSLCVYTVGFSLGLGPIPWLASSELLPVEVKATMSSAAGAFNWFLATCVGFSFPLLLPHLGGYVLFNIFGWICISGIFFVWRLVPETKGRSFQEIQDELGG